MATLGIAAKLTLGLMQSLCGVPAVLERARHMDVPLLRRGILMY
ncbi:MAG: hypothetical protein ABI132_01975 [Rhodanobacteraceae bacterium]